MSLITAPQLKQKALALGFHKVGIAAVPPLSHAPSAPIASTSSPLATDSEAPEPAPETPELPASEAQVKAHLQAWLAQGYQAEMAWMNDPRRQNIRQVMPEARSLISVALNYYTPQTRPQGLQYAKIARYGWGRDYHRLLHRRLKALTSWMQAQAPGIEARYYADTGPVQDKFWAQQAGLGWIAKNGNLITREYGSWVFLGEVITSLELPADPPHTAHCGSCRRCIEACPTAAIRQPGVIDANRCIAYHTIENRAPQLPAAIAANLQSWVAGCDLCQDVCPWNQRFAKPTDVAEFQPYPGQVAPLLAELAELSEADWQARFPASALRRIKPSMWRRNAQAAIDSAAGPPDSPGNLPENSLENSPQNP